MKGMIRRRGTTWSAYWYIADLQGVQRQRSKGGFPLKKAAQSYLAAVLASIDAGSYSEIADKTLTVGRFLVDHWLPTVRSSATRAGTPRRSSTIAQYEVAVRSWLVPHLGGVRLASLTPTHIATTMTALADHGGKDGRPLSGRSCQLSHGILKQALSFGVRAGYVARNVAELTDRPGATHTEMRCWNAVQAQSFLRSVEGDPLYAAWVLLLARGPRRGEVGGVRWSDVDLEAGTMRIINTRVSVGGRVGTSTPKTAAGRRVLHLDAGLIAVLRAHRKRQMEARMAVGPGWVDSGYVFTREDGQPPHPEHLSNRFDALCRKADVPVIRLHDCRHTCATLMLANGVPVKVVAEMLGHSSPSITQSTYQHVLPGMSEDAGAKLSSLLGLGG